MFLIRIVIILVLCAGCGPATAQQRLALLITNQNYVQPGAKLENTHADGDLIKAALEKVGFRVTVVRDTKSEGELLKAIGDHVQRLTEAGPEAVGFFYYSGHGAADRPDGANYLIPTEAPLTHVNQLPLMALRLDKITSTMANVAKMSFVVFDACRNVALARDGKDFGFKGFAPIREQRGLLVAYATEPGNVAIDQSIYARALAEEIVKPGLEAGQVFRAVTRRVVRDTGQKQAPEYLDKRLDDFHFLSQPQQTSMVVTPTTPAATTRPAACDGVNVPLGSGGLACIKPGSGQSFRDCPDCPEMVVVPAGSFMMGSNDGHADEKPVHRVTLAKPFSVGKFEVTFAEWDACVSAGGCNHRPDDQNWGRGKRPVINVRWEDAKEYVAWLSRKSGKTYRLLSEAEWEYAARAGSTTKYAFGDTITKSQAQFTEYTARSADKTVEVGTFKPNAFGLHDMHGNVWEWVEDCYAESYAKTPTDGSKAPETSGCSGRVLRGGSWESWPHALRSAPRFSDSGRDYRYGFRVGRTLTP